MRFLRRLRSHARVAISATALALALGVPGASASASTTPATAVSGDTVYAAWSAHALVQIAHRDPGGRWSRAVAVGRTVGDDSPQLAVDARGDQMLVWQSESVLRSAFLRAGQSTWSVETVAVPYEPAGAQMVMDSRGQATVAWIEVQTGVKGTLMVRTRAVDGAWSEAAPVATDVYSVSLAIDDTDDIVLVYSTGGAWASTLVAGAAVWTPPVAISTLGGGLNASVVAGGARTFVATWNRGETLPSDAVFGSLISVGSARLRLPGGWSAPQALFAPVPAYVPDPSPALFAASVVDALGNATTVTVRGPLGAHRLPAAAGSWTEPEALGSAADGQPGVAVAGDGSSTVAFVRVGRSHVDLRVATARGSFGPWRKTFAGRLRSCSRATGCPLAWHIVTPAVAVAGETTSILVHTPTAVVAVTRATRGERWSQPETLQAADTTNVYLSSAKVKRGAVQVMATCALPPCRGTVVLRSAGASRVLGHASLTIARSVTVSKRIVLSRWAQARIAGGARLHTQLTFGARTGDGTREQADMTILLHA